MKTGFNGFKTCVFIFFWMAAGISGCRQKGPAVSTPLPPSLQSIQYIVYDTFDTGPGTYVRSLAIEGPFLWVGSSLGVLKIQRFSGVLLQTFTQKEGLKSPYIFTISISKDGTKWFGTNAGGLTRFREESWQTFLPPDLADSWVYQIAYQPDGVMWIGTWNGVSRYDGKKFTNYRVKDGLVNPWVYTIAVDQDQSVWMGTEGGVNRFDGKAWQTWTHQDGLGADNEFQLGQGPNNHYGSETLDDINLARHRHNLNTLDETGKETYNENYVFSMFIDLNGIKWFGTWGGGLSRFDGSRWKNYTTKNGLAGNVVYAITPDNRGGLWLGTNNGISYFNGEQFLNFSKKEGLPADDIYTLVQDSERRLWAGHKEGVTRLMPKDLLAALHP
ncbi:MAG: regulator [Nitrospirae bacterium]|nr:regulator [Nitrospirota bacterium]MBI3351983.1 regulator [Nitrospirota bacterium]